MLKLIKSNLLIIAMVFAIGTAVASTAQFEKKAVKKWAYDQNHPMGPRWVDITGLQQSDPLNTRDYDCTLSDSDCTAEFQDTINPNDDPSNPQNLVPGDFSFE